MTPDPLDRVTSMLKGAVADVGDVDALPAGRDVAVARLADALRARARVQRRKRAIYTVAVAAGLALVVGGGVGMARHASHAGSVAGARDLGRVEDPRGVTVLRDGHTEAIGGGARVAEGTELRTSPSSEARLDFDSGTRVTIGGSARVRLVEQSQRKRFSLEAGSLFAKVAKLGPDERFVVATPDAEVEVRGTAFRVTIVPADRACEDGTPTRLDVAEGVVVIRHAGVEHRVAAGDHWPACGTPASGSGAASGAAAGSTPTASPVSAPGAAGGGGLPVIPVGALPASTAPARPASTSAVTSSARGEGAGGAGSLSAPEASSRLAEQNDLFDDAMRLKRSGDASGAVTKLDRLLTLYPSGPLSESASAERMRLLASTDRARAAVAARDYLRRHPRGFARAEAESIAASAP